jgi:hypothetical protein
MSKLELRVRDLKTGDGSVQGFDGEAEALAWLEKRPRFVEVLGVATLELAADVNARLKGALRPLDAEEREAVQKLERDVAAAAAARDEEAAKREQATADAHRAALATADPNRPMEVHFRYDKELELTDAADKRLITAEAREAVMAWIRERDEWVKDRGQMVGDAKVVVYPGPLPAKAGGERVKGGTFIPVTAPAKAN